MTLITTLECPQCHSKSIDNNKLNFCPNYGYQYLRNGNDSEMYENRKQQVKYIPIRNLLTLTER